MRLGLKDNRKAKGTRNMPITLDKLKLIYTPIPKTACTSLKTMFFELENGHAFTPTIRNGREYHIHNVYPSELFNPVMDGQRIDYRRIILVRDPIRRLLSAYSNRVIHHRELSLEKAQDQLAEHDLAPNPSLQEFISKLSKYGKAVQTINHHTQPLVDFAGQDAEFYSRVYKMSEIGNMVADVATIAERPLTLAHLQTGGPKIEIDALRSRDIQVLQEFYSEDYCVFGKYFQTL